jgi:hypothetical protein
MPRASATSNGYLDSADWAKFNSAGTVTANAPLDGSGTTLDPLIIHQASASSSGYLSVGDWNNFNNKLSSFSITEVFIGDGVNTALDIEYAGPSQKGIVSINDQTFGGRKSFANGISLPSSNTLNLYDSDNSNYVAMRAPSTLSGNYTFRLPDGYGTNGQVLTSDGAGNLTWGDSPATGFISYGTTATQSSADLTSNEYLYDVSYGSTSNGNALGARINSTGGSTSGSATGLTVTAVSNGSNNDAVAIVAKATVNGTGTAYALDAEGMINTDTSYLIQDTVVLHNKAQGVYLGNEAGNSITTGASNIAIGYGAMASATTASNNVVIGNNVGANLAGKGNVLIGSGASLGTSAGDSNNVAIGAGAKINNSDAVGSTAIGAMAQVNASHTIVLGAIDGVNGADSSANVGIGTQTPDARLQVVSTDSSTYALKIGGSGTGQFGSVQFAAIKTLGAGVTSMPDGYSFYVFTGNPGATVSPPAGKDGELILLLSTINPDIIVDTYGPVNTTLKKGIVQQLIYYNGNWYPL